MRKIGVEAMDAIIEMKIHHREQTSFSIFEIAKKIDIEPWRIRRSLKSMARCEVPLVWEDGNDRWCVDPRIVKLYEFVKECVLKDEYGK
jgi:DNA-binding IclR family transcriptional regulator